MRCEYDNQPQKEPYALQFAFLAERALYFLSHPERKDDKARSVIGKVDQFIETASRGQEAVETLHMTAILLRI